jgi:hypothetical protein
MSTSNKSRLATLKMQTLAQVNAKADYTFDTHNVAGRRPSTLWRVARCISLWAATEALYGQILAFSLKGDPQIAMDMYLAITANAQYAALTAATRALPPKYRELFEAIWSLRKPLADERHKLAHWLLGYSSDLRSGLLLMNPRDGLRQLAVNIAVRNKKEKEFVPLSPDMIFVLSDKYLNRLAKAMELYNFSLEMFVGMLRSGDRDLVDEQYDRLYSDPEIHAAILRIRGQQLTPKDSKNKSPRRSGNAV